MSLLLCHRPCVVKRDLSFFETQPLCMVIMMIVIILVKTAGKSLQYVLFVRTPCSAKISKEIDPSFYQFCSHTTHKL